MVRNNNMALYLVRAKPRGKADLSVLRNEMDSGKIANLEPFGGALQYSLENARIDKGSNYALWVEEDYCLPPLAMERESVLDRYFEDISVEQVDSEEDGWNRIDKDASSPLWATKTKKGE